MKPIIKGLSVLEPCRVEDLQPLAQAAQNEEHFIFNPTDVIWKDGEIAGYFSVGTVPTVLCWFSKRLKPRESFTLINTIQQSAYRSGARGLFYPVPVASPFHKEMEPMGFKNLGNYDFFLKEF